MCTVFLIFNNKIRNKGFSNKLIQGIVFTIVDPIEV